MSDRETLGKYLRKATAELRDARGRIDELEEREREPVAIVGIACRYPGGAGSPDQLWRLLAADGDGISAFPGDRGWDIERLAQHDPAGSGGVRQGGFLSDAGEFDAEFFGISPREALAMDPQQRLLLEAAWEALEDSGIDPLRLRGGATGVFTGLMHHDYGLGGAGGFELGSPLSTGSGSIASGRVAYALDLKGPAVTVDTACSSSLVAMHLACQALRSGECQLALAGGVTVMATPNMFVDPTLQMAMAADGRCKPFDAAADGVGSSEGVGLLVLERLSEAERNGHRPIALIRGTAVNQDGASNGLTAPNGPSQERVIRQALANAGLAANEVDAVEAHGTGTVLGDPIEAGAILATYGQNRKTPLRLGSIKSNIGHTQAAAGVAGVIKMALAMRHGLLPRTLHLQEPTPHVDWSAGKVELLTEAQPWEPNGRPRRAGVSSFGISGTNAHLIIEEAPAPESEPAPDPEAPPLAATPLLLSAKSEQALRDQAARLGAHLDEHPELELADVAATLAGRTQFTHRAAAVGSDRDQLLEALGALAEDEPHRGLLRDRAGTGKVAFLFPGQGPQWAGMGRELLAHSPVFAAAIDACEEALGPFVDFSLREVLQAGMGDEPVEVIQPALFATMVALAGLWRHHGVEPAAVVGHSQGEIAAAHVAGALSLEDAARVVALRSQALRELAGKGGMVSVQLPAERLAERIEPWGQSLGLAAENSPHSTVVSGEPGALAELLAACEADGIRARRIAVDYASHSPQVEAIRERLLADLAPIEPRPGEVPFYSAMSAQHLEGSELGAEYWYRSLREPVRFAGAIAALLRDGFDTFVETSAHPVLTMAVQESAAEQAEDVGAIGTLRRDEGGLDRFAASLAAAHLRGAPVEWATLFGRRRRVPLPTYPFQRRRYWLEPSARVAGEPAAIGQSDPTHPLLGAAIQRPDEDGWLLTGRLSLQSHPWLADHALLGTSVFPGTGFLELALRGAEQAGATTIEELTIEAPLTLPERGGVQLQVNVGEADESGNRPLAIHCRREEPEAKWVRHATGALSSRASSVSGEPGPEWPPAAAEAVAVDDFYRRAAELGVDYGPAFQGLKAVWRRGEELFAEVELDEEQRTEAEGFAIHPALLDAALQPSLLLGREGEGLRVPFSWGGVSLRASGADFLRVQLKSSGEKLSLRLSDASGVPVAAVEGLFARSVDLSELQPARAGTDSLFALQWSEVTLPPAREAEAEIRRFECSPPLALDPPRAAEALCAEVLNKLQAAIAAETEERIAFVTRGAVVAADGDSPDPAAAAVWGLVGSAQAEHPGRFVVIDIDGGESSDDLLGAALALEVEPQLALRDGAVLAPRVVRAPEPSAAPPQLDPEGTVLITGGTGTLGSLFARHLVAAHGVRRLLLASRRGPETPGAGDLAAELADAGAEVEVVACDVAERSQLEGLLDAIPTRHPLTAVFHAAGTTDDGLVDSLDSGRLATTMAPKGTAAWHLHELTREIDGCELVFFSSLAGTLPSPGQGNYAAANAFLDALAHARRAEGLAGSSLGWGGWREQSELTAHLSEAARARIARNGAVEFSTATGLELFDRAWAVDRAHLLPVTMDTAALRELARAGTLAPLLSGLVRVPAARGRAGSLAARLTAVTEGEREGLVLDLVRKHVAAVLGHSPGEAVDPKAAFKDLGFDSLAAVELRNRLGQACGLRLPATLVFDYPSTEAVAGYLRDEVEGGSAVAGAPTAAIVRSEEPIAIVGIGCRYPGGAVSPQKLWRLLAGGEDAIGPFPGDRGWDLERIFDPDPGRTGTSYARDGGFLGDAADFDAEFFSISPREALSTDPQHRLLLEATWEALEDAGVDPASLGGSATGVFAGLMHHDYGLGADQSAVSSGSAASGRIAYSFGLEGPAVTVDTACSSSLVAMHLACQALRAGECGLALAGGVTVLATPGAFLEFGPQLALARDGRCKSFDAGADGTGFSEGVGLLVLERLSEAERNGHQPIALIRGTAVNQDGASNGLTAPNGPSQERVIRQALANAGLAASEVDAVEAHGTGTVLGDPIEAGAILATYGQNRETPLRLGSIKSNIGHTQAAAGVAGVIKMALAMRHGLLPRTLHLQEPTPHVDWSAGKVELLAEPQPWEAGDRPRRAGVSSFGATGTNAHLILEEAPAHEAEPSADPEAPPLAATPLLLSAKSEEALRDQAARLGAHLDEHPELELADVGYSLAARTQFTHRAAVLGEEREELLEALGALSGDEPHRGLLRDRAGTGKLAFLFPGQGPQWAGMGRELLAHSPVFAAAIDACEEALGPFVDFSLREVLEAGRGDEPVDVVHPALFATMVALARLWRHHGVEPAATLGHSQGEIAAAHVAGALSLDDAARVVALRSQALTEIAGKGGMLSVRLPAEQLAERLEPWGESLSLAAENSPLSSGVSGDPEALAELLSACEADGIRARPIAVDCASHSPQVEAIRERLLADLAPIEPRPGEVPFYSAMSAERLDGSELGAEYWYRSMRAPVRFAAATAALLEAGFETLVEASVHPVLTMAVEESAAAQEMQQVAAIGTLRRDEGGLGRFAASLAAAHLHGAPVEWATLFGRRRRVPLPTYPFQRRRYWLAGGGEADLGAAGLGAAEHPLLGAVTPLPAQDGWLLTARLSLDSHPWLADHSIFGTVILPGTAFVELALQGAEQAGMEAIEELTIEAPLVLPERGGVQLQVSVGEADESGNRAVAIHSRADEADAEWLRNAAGILSAEPAPQPDGLAGWPPAGAEAIELGSFYETVAELGVDYGPAFQGLKAAWRQGEEIFAEVELDEEQGQEAGSFALHPALLDAALHPITMLAESEEARVPFSWGGVSLAAAGARQLRVRLSREGDEVSLQIADADGLPVAAVERLSARPIDPSQLQAATALDSLFVVQWRQLALPEAAADARLVDCRPDPQLDVATAAQALCEQVLVELQAAIVAESQEPLAFVTRSAVAVAEGEPVDPAGAAVWGLVRSAQAEHPGRFLLIDSDASEASQAAIAVALAIPEEPQLALRRGDASVPRLLPAPFPDAEPGPFDPEGTVLITGGTGLLGALFARHLVRAYGVRHLVLTSRNGLQAAGALELREELSGLGAEAEVVACDVSDRARVEELLAAIPAEHPLVAVVHSAGATDDSLIQGLDSERLAAAMAPKAAAAWHLHELTREIEGCELILFSSITGVLQSPGQGNYAAANAFIDALAFSRRAAGLAGTSLGWGGWEDDSELTAKVKESERARIRSYGMTLFSAGEGLALFDRARAVGLPYLMPIAMDSSIMRARARDRTLAPIFSGLVRVAPRRARGATGSLAKRLAGVPKTEHEGVVVELVRKHVAAVLGHGSAEAVDPSAAFQDLGFDSMAAIELRNRLDRATGLRLPATVVFDYPSAAAVAGYLLERVGGAGAGPSIDDAIDGLRAMLQALDPDERELAGARLRSLAGDSAIPADSGLEGLERIQSASAEELLEIVDDEIGAR